jgi:hypothetical protein
VGIEGIARAILSGDALAVRSLVQDWLSTSPSVAAESLPTSSDVQIRALSAALSELFAIRLAQQPPIWAREIGPLDEPLYLLTAARTMPRLRRLCEEEAPAPLRRRRLFAPRDYLTFA